jgi:hypothetical protein
MKAAATMQCRDPGESLSDMAQRPPEPPQFPAGPFVAPASHDHAARTAWIDEIEQTPAHLRHAVAGLADADLDASIGIGRFVRSCITWRTATFTATHDSSSR